MALDINGYNSVFSKFVDFAEKYGNVDKGRAIFDAQIQSPLDGRKLLSINLAKNDSVHNWTRRFDQWTVNDHMHDIFKNAIIDIAGEKPVVSDVKIAQKFDILSHENVA